MMKQKLSAVVQNRDWPNDGLYSDRECFALASLVVYIQPFENRSVRLLVSYSRAGDSPETHTPFRAVAEKN